MKRIDRFILKSYSGPMVMTFFISIFVLLMQFLWLFIDELVGKGLEWSVIGEFLFWASITLVPMALPLSTLLASIMTMGNLGENNELLALKSAGISLQRIMMPLFILIFAVSALAFYISNNMLPLANLKIVTMRHDIQKKRPDLMLSSGVFTNDMPNYSLRIGSKDPTTNRLNEVMIYDHTMRSGNLSVTIADSGYISATKDGKYMVVTLYNGNTYQDERNDKTMGSNYPFSHRQFERQEFLVSIPDWDRANEDMYKGSYSMMLNIATLSKEIDSLRVLREQTTDAAMRNFMSSASFQNVAEFDTAQTSIHRHVIATNTDSLFTSYGKEQKARAIQEAITKAEAAQAQVKFVNENMGLENQRKRIAQNEVEWHMKFTLSAACLIFFFIGAPLGAIIRKGGLGMPMVLSLVLFLFYWVLFSTGKKMAIQGSWNTAVAMWLPSMILLPLGMFLTYKSTTDSALFNADRYIDFFKKIFGRSVGTKKINPSKINSTHSIDFAQMSKENLLRALSNHSRQAETLLMDHFGMTNKGVIKGYAWVEDRKEWLIEFEKTYNELLAVLILKGADEEFHSILKTYPALNARSYIYKGWDILGICLLSVFPINLIFISIRAAYKKRELKNILKEIVEVNRKVEDYIKYNEQV